MGRDLTDFMPATRAMLCVRARFVRRFHQLGGWIKTKPPGEQVLVHVSTYQSNPFWGYPIFDNHSHVGARNLRGRLW